MSVQTHSSLNSALQNAASVAESLHSEGGGEEEAPAFQGVEEQEQQPSHVNENGWKPGEDGRTVHGSNGQHFDGGLEGLATQVSSMGSIPIELTSEGDEASSSLGCELFEASELQLIEDALRRRQSVEEGKTEDSQAAEHTFSFSNDLQEVARLLKKVQSVRARSTRSSPDSSVGQGPPGGEKIWFPQIFVRLYRELHRRLWLLQKLLKRLLVH